tara:strand:- start:425 stop:4084 length:3660 start_codon:yes stop_codon:yes gene_type:complete
MAQETVREAAERIRAGNPQFSGLDDQSVVDQYLQSYPQHRDKIIDAPTTTNWSGFYDRPPATPYDSGGGSGLVATGLRIVPSVVGSFLGGAAGAVGGLGVGAVPGALAGSATGAGIGEWLAQKYEGRPETNWKQIGTQTVLGGVPFGKMGTIGSTALKSAGIGGVANIATKMAEGQDVDPVGDFLTGAVLGGGLGAGTHKLASMVGGKHRALTPDEGFQPTSVAENTAEGRRAALNRDRSRLASGDLDDPNVRPLSERMIKKFSDYKVSARKYIQEQQKHYGLADEVTATDRMDTALGGAQSHKIEINDQIQYLKQRAVDEGIDEDVTSYLDLSSMQQHMDVIEDRAQEKLAKGDLDDFLDVADDGLFGYGWNKNTVQSDLTDLQAKMSPERWARVQETAHELHGINMETLARVHKSGLISDEFYTKLVDRVKDPNKGYTPLTRFMTGHHYHLEANKLKRANASAEELGNLKKFFGSERVIVDPYTASMNYRYAANDAIGKNDAAAAFGQYHDAHSSMREAFPVVIRTRGDMKHLPGYKAKKLKEGQDYSTIDSSDRVGHKTEAELDAQFGKGEWGTFSYKRNGEDIDIAAPNYVADSVKLMDSDTAQVFGQTLLTWTGGVTRRMATAANLAFSVTNVPRDVMDMALLGNVINNPGDFLRYAKEWTTLIFPQLLRTYGKGAPLGLDKLARKTGWGSGRRAVRGREAFLRDGAGGSTLQAEISGDRLLRISELEAVGKSAHKRAAQWMDDAIFGTTERFSNALEETTKLASYNVMGDAARLKAGLKAGEQLPADVIEKIVLETRRYGGSPDFNVHGANSRQMNALVLFYNAQVQGIMRNVKGYGRLIGKSPEALGAGPEEGNRKKVGYIMAGILGAELVRNQMNRSYVDSDGTPSMDRITDTDEENYWSFVTPWTEVVDGIERQKIWKMSKGHAARPLFNPVAAIIRNADRELTDAGPQRGRRDAKQIAVDTASQFLPGSFNIRTDKPMGWEIGRGAIASLNPALRAPIEQSLGVQAFSDVPMVPRRMEKLPATEQYTDDTSQLAVKLGQMTGASPMQLEAFARGTFPGPGEQFMGVADTAIRTAQGELSPLEAAGGIGEAILSPLERRFEGSGGDQIHRDQQSTFYRMLERAEEANAEIRRAEVNRDPNLKNLIQENRSLLKMRLPLLRISQQLGELRRLPDEKALPIERKLLQAALRVMNPLTTENLEKFYRNYQERE